MHGICESSHEWSFEIVAFIALDRVVYLALGRGGFWLLRASAMTIAEQRLRRPRPATVWPRVAVVIPARDEADGIGRCLASLFRQDYRGPWSVVAGRRRQQRRHRRGGAARRRRLRRARIG